MNMVNIMKIKFIISPPNDSANQEKVSLLFNTTNKSCLHNLYSGRYQRTRRLNQFGEVQLVTQRLGMQNSRRAKLDPILHSLNKIVKAYLLPHRSNTAHYMNMLTRKIKGDGNYTLFFGRTPSGTFHVNHVKLSKEDMISTISKFILRITICKDIVTLDDYVEKLLTYPPNVLYVLENRTPYTFYDNGIKQEVRINTRDIGNKEIAMEISDGIWGTLSIKDMNTFVNTFKHGSERSKKWSRITPRRLWFEIMGTECSEAQLKLMIAWLKQNRTEDMVDKRAEELLYSLDDVPNMFYFPNFATNIDTLESFMQDYSDRFTNRLRKAVLVRGQTYDWILVSKRVNSEKHSVNRHQSVDSLIISKRNNEGNSLLRFTHDAKPIILTTRSICIDNVQNNSSIGDQLSTRAYIAMNDKSVTDAGMIHTIPKPTEDHEKYRLTLDEFNSLVRTLRNFNDMWGER